MSNCNYSSFREIGNDLSLMVFPSKSDVSSVAFMPLWSFHRYFIEFVAEDMVQTEKSEKQLYQFLG